MHHPFDVIDGIAVEFSTAAAMNSASSKIKVIIADDHPIVSHGLVSLLSGEPDFTVVATCADGVSALEAIRTHRPDIAILDFRMPGLSGLEVLAHVIKEGLPTKSIFLTATANDRHVIAAITRRAHGLLLKENAPDDLVACLRAVSAGKRWIAAEVIQAALGGEILFPADMPTLPSLSTREREVMDLVAAGFSNKEVATKLSLTEGTVKLHLHSIYEKTGVTNRTALAALTLRLQS
jgi:DNA-binding NarL/FixJ family response regulator